MIWFLAAAAALSVIFVAVLLRPLVTRRRTGASERGEPVALMFSRQLVAIDEEVAEGRLAAAAGETARAEITRRLLAAAEREDGLAGAAIVRRGEGRWRFAAAVGIAGVLPAAAVAIYFAVGTPEAVEHPQTAEPGAARSEAELAAAAEQLQAHLRQSPGDLKGWGLLGRTLAALRRFPQALDAYNHAIALAPADAGLHAEFGEVLVLQAKGIVTPDAEVQFAKAADDPRSRYYEAEAALQRGDRATAKRKFAALLADAPADAPWRQTVADRLAELSPSGADAAPAQSAPPAAGSGGPSAQDLAAAQALTPEQRQTMIRGMVERLAQRLERHPDDKAGWERLAHAYDVLGEADKAAAARARAAAAPDPAAPPAASAAAPAAAVPAPPASAGKQR